MSSASKKIDLSITIIGHNEANHLKQLLPTLDWAKEIIYVDCESGDDSLEVARKYKCRTFSCSNDLSFSEKRNFTNAKSSNDWVLYLDPDERLTKDLKQSLLYFDSGFNAFYIKRRNFYFKKFLQWGGYYPDKQLRFYKKTKGTFPNSLIHEKLNIEDGKIGELNGDLLHYSYTSITEYLRKFNFYTSFEAKVLLEKKTKINFFNFISFVFLKPADLFLSQFVFKRGFLDGWSGFIAAFFSALHFPVRFFKLWEMKGEKGTAD